MTLNPFETLIALAHIPIGIQATRTALRRRRPRPSYWCLDGPKSGKTIWIEEGMAPDELARLGRQIVRHAEESGALGDATFIPPEYR